ncbi:F-box/FBD/LRR-repeat protein At5g22660 [Capsella rubella]|uniref:F-box/FBD/LRR-repeat protein At5g22660 n=1 Tax=Capsella rubella TaxID=81985 RepID=UPI000CD50826|nr:F-box/FBD/LRR-repeat protein At5g22660 [Capsella rubella]
MQITCLDCFSQKRNQMSNQGAIKRSGGDGLSSFPDHLLSHMLSYLPTKTAVTTSTLSPTWINLWHSTPVLDIEIDDFDDFDDLLSFTSRFLEFHKDSSLHKLKFSFETELRVSMCRITAWLTDVVKRKIQHLEVMSGMDHKVDMAPMPIVLYLCETLVSLRLHCVVLSYFQYVSLPNLKMMHLEENIYMCEETLENLISACPVLEDLTLVRKRDYNDVEVLRVRSQSLKRFKLVVDRLDYIEGDVWKVIIDAPRLAYLRLADPFSVSFVISNLGSSAEVDIDVGFNVNIWKLDDSFERSAVRKLLTGLSSVKDMAISGTTLKIISHYLKHERMPQFQNMTWIQAEFYISDLGMLPGVLECCPNLIYLDVHIQKLYDEENEEIIFSSVPRCLQTSLEAVEIVRYKHGDGAERRLTKYLLENSLVLKKFALYFDCPNVEQEDIIYTELETFEARSLACEIEFRVLEKV